MARKKRFSQTLTSDYVSHRISTGSSPWTLTECIKTIQKDIHIIHLLLFDVARRELPIWRRSYSNVDLRSGKLGDFYFVTSSLNGELEDLFVISSVRKVRDRYERLYSVFLWNLQANKDARKSLGMIVACNLGY